MQSVFSSEPADVCLPGKELPLYQDFPYIITRLAAGLYHRSPLPEVVDPHNLVPVSCRCENVNRCAACFRPVAARKLNANHFNVADGTVWHVPGFAACSHPCHGTPAYRARQCEGGTGL
jgi:hypothetical protein